MKNFFPRRRWTRLLAALAALYFSVAGASWLAVPWAVRRALREVPKNLPGFDARISEAHFNPFKLALTVRGFAFSHEKLGDLATCEEFYASFQPLDLLRFAVGLRRLRLTRPRLIAVIAADGSSALSELPKPAAAPAATSAPPAKESAPFIPRVVVHRFMIERGALEFESRLPSAPQRLVADPIDFTLENLSTIRDDRGAYSFSARTDHGERLSWNGTLSLRPVKLSGRIAAEGADLARESTAVPSAPVALTAGKLDASTDYEISYTGGVLSAALTGARLSLKGIFWKMRGAAAAPRGPFALEIGPSRLVLRAPMPAAPGAKTTLSAETLVAGRGEVRLDASAATNPLSGNARLIVKDFPLAPFNPLVPPPTDVSIDSGAVSLDAKTSFAAGGRTDGEAAFSLDGFALSDRLSRRTLVKIGRFAIDGAKVSIESKTASVQRVSLEHPYLRVFRGKNGVTNIEDALGVRFSSETATASTTTATAAADVPARTPVPRPWRTTLARFTMSGGRVVVQDEDVEPAFALTVQDARMELKNLTSDARSTATFELQGRVESAPFSVAGDVRLSSAAAWADARVKTDGLQLSAFEPYSNKVLGYKLDRGTLNLELDEALAGRDIRSRNKITVDQLTLGEKVDSPTALKVPIKLGLAILKDRRGVIDLDVPIAGSLDDPQFRVLPIALKTLVNIIIKAATSPFDALGASLGGGADLGHVAFAPVSVALTAQTQASLDKVAQALADRPSLSVGVRGSAGNADALALGDAALRRRLRGADAGDPTLTPSEEKRTVALYAKTFGAAAPSLDAARAKLDETFAGGEADLRTLAAARVNVIQDYLLSKGLDPKRFYSLEPAVDAKAVGTAPCELQLDAH